MKPHTVATQIPKPIPVREDEASAAIKDRIVNKSVSDTVRTNRRAKHGRFYLEVVQPVCLYVLNKIRNRLGGSTPVTRLSDRAIGYIGGLSEIQQKKLQAWVDVASPEERSGRMQAVEKIEWCVEKGEKALDLGGLKLTALPDMIGDLTWLNVLDCEENELSGLPQSIARLTRLRELYCQKNNLATLPASFSVPGLKRLVVLQLSDNQLVSLPAGLGHLKRLEVLDCYGNCLGALPPEIFECTHLMEVYLGGNQISSVPPGLNRLRHLQRLNLAFNRLPTVPDQLTEIKNQDRLPCRVYLQGNAFVEEDVLEWCRTHSLHPSVSLLASKRMSPGVAAHSSLKQAMENWFSMAGQLLPEDLITAFDDPTKANAIHLHLQQLVGTKDYKEGTFAQARAMAQRVTLVLQAMADDQDVMDACYAAAVEATSSCQDRALLGLNDMELAIKVVKAEKKGGLMELIKLQEGLHCKKLVEELADTRFAEIEKDYGNDLASGQPLTREQLRKPDQIEVRLAYLLGLQEKLNLPVESGQQMKWGWYSRVTEADIKKAYDEISEKLNTRTEQQKMDDLMGWDAYTDRLEQAYPGYMDSMNQKYLDLMTDECKNLNEWDFENLSGLLDQQRKLEKKEFLQEATARLLQGSPLPDLPTDRIV